MVLPPGFRRSVRRPSVRRCGGSVRRPSVRPSVRFPGLGSGSRPCWFVSVPAGRLGSPFVVPRPGRCPFPSLSFGAQVLHSWGQQQGCVVEPRGRLPPQLLAGGSAYTRDPRFALYSGGDGLGERVPWRDPRCYAPGPPQTTSASEGNAFDQVVASAAAATAASAAAAIGLHSERVRGLRPWATG